MFAAIKSDVFRLTCTRNQAKSPDTRCQSYFRGPDPIKYAILKTRNREAASLLIIPFKGASKPRAEQWL